MGELSNNIAKLHQELGNSNKTAPKMVTPDELFVGQQAGTTANEFTNGYSAKKLKSHAQTGWTDVDLLPPGQIGSSFPFPRDPD
jgi:hypothetical protein